MRCNMKDRCRAFSAEGYSACRDCPENEEFVENKDDKKEVTFESSVDNAKIIEEPLPEPPIPDEPIKLSDGEIAYKKAKHKICNAFDSENKSAFVAEFMREAETYMANKRQFDANAEIRSSEAVDIYKKVAVKYPRKHYDKDQTFNIIKVSLESVFGHGVLKQKIAWPTQFGSAPHNLSGLDERFLNAFYDYVETLPVLERKRLTNGYINLLVTYIFDSSNRRLSLEEFNRIVAECKQYFTKYYELRKKYDGKKIKSKTLTEVINDSLGHEDIGEPFVQLREK